MGEREGSCALVVQISQRPVAGQAQPKADGRVDRGGRRRLVQPVLAGDVGGAAVSAVGGRADRAGESAGSARRIDDHIGCERMTVHPHARCASTSLQKVVDVAGGERYPRLGLRRIAQDAIERHPPTQQCRGSPVGRSRQSGAGRRQIIQHVGHFGLQRLDNRSAEGVGVMKLHHALALPRSLRRRSGITVDDDDGTAATGQCNGGEQTSRPGADDHSPHEFSN